MQIKGRPGQMYGQLVYNGEWNYWLRIDSASDPELWIEVTFDVDDLGTAKEEFHGRDRVAEGSQ